MSRLLVEKNIEDDFIDRKRFEIEEQCIDLIATQQPLAIDLRMLLAVLHIAVALERMGDYAEG
ncbi:phosphate transport system regulatory protein PhoU, partial [Patescibacteria group bacterium]|nr:phosphate transport system regulatory protein PhoU [Patescibacteria group bacterium]